MDAAERKVLALLATGKINEDEAEEMLDAVRSAPTPNGKGRIVTQIVGGSDLNRALLTRIEEVARTEDHVLVEGETGTGKMLISKAIHFNGPRADQPILFLDAGATDATIETELFGVEPDPANGQRAPTSGLLRLAKRGTVGIDSIDRLSPNIQQRLAAYCADGHFSRAGGTTILRADVRIIGLTNQSLQDAVDQGRFRADLYDILSKNTVASLPLRDRIEDLPEIVDHFIQSAARDGETPTITKDALERLTAHTWPRNCRELHEVIIEAVDLSDGETITPEMLKVA